MHYYPCVWVHVCMCMRSCVYVHVYTYVHVRTYEYTCMCACDVHVRTYMCIHACVHVVADNYYQYCITDTSCTIWGRHRTCPSEELIASECCLHTYIHTYSHVQGVYMWQSQVEKNIIPLYISGLIRLVIRISRMLY